MSMHEKVNILMVDDQPGKLLTYEAILGELGENLIKASSGREALEHLLKNEYCRGPDGRQHAGTRRIRIGRHDPPAPSLSGNRHHLHFRRAPDRSGPHQGLSSAALWITSPFR